MSNFSGQKPLLCRMNKKPVIWKLPKFSECSVDNFSIKEKLKKATITLYRKNIIEYQSPGFLCRLDSSTIRQQTHINGNPEITETENAKEKLYEEECRRMITQKVCTHGTLKAHHNIYRTTNEIKIDPPNRFISFISGTKNDIKRNCVLIPIKIFAKYNSDRPVSALGDLSECSYQKEFCRVEENEVIVWHPNKTQNCEFIKAYEEEALLTKSIVLIDKIHFMLTYNYKAVKSCGRKLMLTDQNLAFEIRSKKSKRQLKVADKETADLQCLEHLQNLQRLASTLCHIITDHQKYISEIIKLEQTYFIRKLLKKENVFATRINSNTTEVRFCHEFNLSEYRILPNERNCSIPVLLRNKTVLYLNRNDHTLHRDPKKTTEEKDCGNKLILSLEGKVMEYVRKTRILKHLATQQHEATPQNENWKFLEEEQILRDILVIDSDVFEESVLTEIERVTEAKTKTFVTDQTVFTHESIGEDLWLLPNFKYLKYSWFIWVTIVASFCTYGGLCAIISYCKRQYPQQIHFKEKSSKLIPIENPLLKETPFSEEVQPFSRTPDRLLFSSSIIKAKRRQKGSVAFQP